MMKTTKCRTWESDSVFGLLMPAFSWIVIVQKHQFQLVSSSFVGAQFRTSISPLTRLAHGDRSQQKLYLNIQSAL